MKPKLVTEHDLAGVLDELSRREPIFHREELGRLRVDFERMTADDFWEVGASGRQYSRVNVLDLLESRYAAPYEDDLEATEFRCQQLAPDLYLLTYTLLQDKVRLTRRSTIWRNTHDGWKIVFHQGTIVQDA